jgi:hypothetical protein
LSGWVSCAAQFDTPTEIQGSTKRCLAGLTASSTGKLVKEFRLAKTGVRTSDLDVLCVGEIKTAGNNLPGLLREQGKSREDDAQG